MKKSTYRALLNLSRMKPHKGDEPWWNNQIAHWLKHTQPVIVDGKVVKIPDTSYTFPGPSTMGTEDDYLDKAREICRSAAFQLAGTEFKERRIIVNGHYSGLDDILVWYHPPDLVKGIFVAIEDVGPHSELRTLFTPDEGYYYFKKQYAERKANIEKH